MRKKIVKLYACIIAVGIVYYLIVRLTGFGIPCVLYEKTGLLCPGCGISRMLIEMFRLNFYAAFSYNQVMFILFFIWNFIALFAFIGKPLFFRKSKFLYSMLGISILSLAIFTFVRNFV